MNAPPMSAPPFNNFSAFGNIGNTNKRADRDEQKQIFFGSNFDSKNTQNLYNSISPNNNLISDVTKLTIIIASS
jgi:hypothetical protein